MIEIKVQVPCTPLVQAHLHNQYGDPVRFTKGATQTLFYSLLEKCIERTDLKKNAFEATVDVLITESIYLRRGIYFTNQAARDLNSSVTDMIYDMLFMHMRIAGKLTKTKLRKKDCIETFCDELQLPEESFSYERCKKAYWRYRNKNNGLRLSA